MKTLDLKQTYLSLPHTLYSKIQPYNNINSSITLLNTDLANELNLDKDFLFSEKGLKFLSGSTDQEGDLFSQAYSGHQYGYFTTLGDGRAVLLGEHSVYETLYDLQLKGSGRTPYSRRGDGKATLYSMLREYLISEAMHRLGIATTRSLAVLNTNETIQRMTPEQGGILCRVARSHIRVGTFEYARANTDFNALKQLADYTINRHYPHLNSKENKYQQFLGEVIKGQAELIAKWQSIGFVHGVMNTDNMTISGETIDYGPCAFLDSYDPSISYSSIDQNGRYSYKNQPFIGSWNLARFAESILVLLDDDHIKATDKANEELEKYQEYYFNSYYSLFAKKLGIEHPTEEDKKVIDDLLSIMEKYNADFTNTFRLLTLSRFEELSFYKEKEYTEWFQNWTRQLGYRKINPSRRIALMEKHNPAIIPRNHLVEEVLLQASKENNLSGFQTFLEVLKDPYNYKKTRDSKYTEPNDSNEQYVTYCGT